MVNFQKISEWEPVKQYTCALENHIHFYTIALSTRKMPKYTLICIFIHRLRSIHREMCKIKYWSQIFI